MHPKIPALKLPKLCRLLGIWLLVMCGWQIPSLPGQDILVGMKTLGGPMMWTDYVIQSDWRIQRHERLGHYRLLDPRNRRIANGTLEHCYCRLQQLKRNGQIAPMQGHAVILLHGLSGTRGLMSEMERKLEAQGFCVINFGYASTKACVQELTVGLESVLRNLDGVHSVSFVGHSLGNLIVRHMLFRFEYLGLEPPVAFHRMVMISPPNQGAHLADTLGQRRIVKLLRIKVIDQLAPHVGWDDLNRQMVVPNFEFGILAGGRGNDRGYFCCLPGDDDGLLTVRTYYLPGVTDYEQVGGLHQLLPKNDLAIEATIHFLKCGHF